MTTVALLSCLAAIQANPTPPSQTAPAPKPEILLHIKNPMVTGVTVSKSGRIFLCFPRWGDPVDATVKELRDGRLVPYPSAAFNRLNKKQGDDRFVSVQSVVVDPQDRLWAVDTGSVKLGMTIPGAPKLVCFDLNTNRVARVYHFPSQVVFPTSYLNDVRFDLTHGQAGYAFLTDSSDKGPNGIVVVDLATGDSWRRLNDHPSTKAEPGFVPVVNGQKLMKRPKFGPPQRVKMGSDGIAIDVAHDALYYCPLVSRRLYSVSVQALEDRTKTDDQVRALVQDLGVKGASDGLETDDLGTLYVTDYERNQVKRRDPDGGYVPIMKFAPYLWPDTMSFQNGYLYATANELELQPVYQRGKDRRHHRYVLVRIRVRA